MLNWNHESIKEVKNINKVQRKQIKNSNNMEGINPAISMFTSHVNGLNLTIERKIFTVTHKEDPTVCCI